MLLCFFLHQSLIKSHNRLTGVLQKGQVASADGGQFSELQVNTIRPKHTQKHRKQPIKIANDTMEYYSAINRNEIRSFVEMWMDLATVIQSEVSQKEKNKYCILTYVSGN